VKPKKINQEEIAREVGGKQRFGLTPKFPQDQKGRNTRKVNFQVFVDTWICYKPAM